MKLKNILLVVKDIEKSIEKVKRERIDPFETESQQIFTIVADYIKANDKIIYGGIAHNKAIGLKDVRDCFYDDNCTPDYDFYSADPIADLVKIANSLHEKGFKYIYCRDALHTETYSLTVKGMVYCDVTYVPEKIYSNMPTITVDNVKYVHPHFAIVDYLRMFTDPINSTFRWEKALRRFRVLWTHYKIPDFPWTPVYSRMDEINKFITDIISRIASFGVIFIGDFVFNHYLKLSGKKQMLNSHIGCLSVNYVHDVTNIYCLLKKSYNKVDTCEFYPFFQFTGRCTMFTINDNIILRIYDNTGVCTPFVRIIYESVENVNIGTFTLVLLYYLIDAIRNKVYNLDIYKNLYSRIYRIIEIRNEYLEKHDKTIFDDTVFKEFVTNVVGTTFALGYKKILLFEKGVPKLAYSPESKTPFRAIRYSNTTGDKIFSKYTTIELKSAENREKSTAHEDNESS